jgi:hypothetical protein
MFHEVICFYKSLSCYSAANIQKKSETCKRLTPISIELTKKCTQNDGKQFRFTWCFATVMARFAVSVANLVYAPQEKELKNGRMEAGKCVRTEQNRRRISFDIR